MKWMYSAGRCLGGGTVLLPLVCILGCAVGVAQPTNGRDGADPERTLLYGQLPVRLCLDLSPREAAALRSGERRLLLRMRHQQRSQRYSPSFAVSLVKPASELRQPLGNFAMHPDQPTESSRPDAQSFGFDVSAHLADAALPSRVCVDVSIDDGDPAVARLATRELSAALQLSTR